MKKLSISHLEWHVAHACNFTCEGCCHFSNHGHSVPVSYNDIEQWYNNWCHRIAPKHIDILGGEPLLNKRICDIVELTRNKWDDPSLESD
ncbi:MAG: 4Fe-4S cluster-binding domain-containing protein, partial [Methylophagaceae bacterium]